MLLASKEENFLLAAGFEAFDILSVLKTAANSEE